MIEKIFRIARAEYLNSVTSKAFVLGVLATPLMIGIVLLIEKVSSSAKGGKDRRVAIVDQSGRLFAPLQEKANDRNANELMKDGKKVRPAFYLEQF